jgi:hypothetical protein
VRDAAPHASASTDRSDEKFRMIMQGIHGFAIYLVYEAGADAFGSTGDDSYFSAQLALRKSETLAIAHYLE